MLSDKQATEIILKELTAFLAEHEVSFSQALHALKIVRPIKVRDIVICCEPDVNEPSLKTLNRMFN